MGCGRNLVCSTPKVGSYVCTCEMEKDCRNVCGGAAKLDVCGECEGIGKSCAGRDVLVFTYGKCEGRTQGELQKIEKEVQSRQQQALQSKEIKFKRVFAAAGCRDDKLVVNVTVTRRSPDLSEEEKKALVLAVGGAAGQPVVLVESNSFAVAPKITPKNDENMIGLWILLAVLAAVLLISTILALFFLLRTRVFVKLPSGHLEQLNISLEITVLELKKTLTEKTGLPMSEQRLFYSGVVKGKKTVGPATQIALEPDSAILGKDLGLQSKALINLQAGADTAKAELRGNKDAPPSSMFHTNKT